MAQPVHCDVHNREHLADVMVHQIATGEVFAACGAGFAEWCRMLVDTADQAEADETDADAEARLTGVQRDMPVDDEAAAAEIVASMAEAEASAVPPTSPGSSDAGAVAPGPRTRHGDERNAAAAHTDADQGAEAAPGPS